MIPAVRRHRAVLAAAGLLVCAACAPVSPPPTATAPRSPRDEFHETPAPVSGWRGHRLARCPQEDPVPPAVQEKLEFCAEMVGNGSGSDGMIELEMTLAEGHNQALLLLTLGQLYLMAGQGAPQLLPSEGPAADVGDWERNRIRLLGRARDLLTRAGEQRPDDAAVDYLLADVARAGGDYDLAGDLVMRGEGKCTGGASFEILRRYQELGLHPARLLDCESPVYPPQVLSAGIAGDVTLDLLLDPAGRVRQFVVVDSPHDDLSAAAIACFATGSYEAARIGKYTVWAWLRTTTSFSLTTES